MPTHKSCYTADKTRYIYICIYIYKYSTKKCRSKYIEINFLTGPDKPAMETRIYTGRTQRRALFSGKAINLYINYRKTILSRVQ